MRTTDLRVMQSFRQPKATSNPYIHMLDAALDETPGLEHLRFSWRRAFFGRYHAVHFHWPEILLEGRTPARRLVRRLRLQALLVRLRVTRTAIVRTVHNLELPSGIGRWDRRMLSAVRERARVNIALNAATAVARGPVVVIPHGHYIDWFAGMPRTEPRAGRIAFVGLVRRYKGVETLIQAYAQLRDRRDDISLAVSGRPSSSELAEELVALAASLPAVSLRFEYLSESDYAEAVMAAELVVLPYVHMHNSGSALAVLSLDRAVLVPDNDVNRALRAEAGAGWVHIFTETLTADDVDGALVALRKDPPATGPDLSARGWADAGRAHLSAYLEAVRPAVRRRASAS